MNGRRPDCSKLLLGLERSRTLNLEARDEAGTYGAESTLDEYNRLTPRPSVDKVGTGGAIRGSSPGRVFACIFRS